LIYKEVEKTAKIDLSKYHVVLCSYDTV